MSNVQLMRGEGNLSLLRGVQYLTRDIKKAKTWVLNHSHEIVDEYPEYGTYYMDGGIKRRVHAKKHESWGMGYYAKVLNNYLRSNDARSDGTENFALYAVEQVLTNPNLIALMKGAQYVPKLVVGRVQSPNNSKHIGVYTLKSLPAATKFEVKRRDFGNKKSWMTSIFIDSQLALDFLAFSTKYAVLIAEVSLKLKRSKILADYQRNKRDLEYAEVALERRQKSYDEWLTTYDADLLKWQTQEAWLKTMPDHLSSHEVGRYMRHTQGAVERDPVVSVGIWDRDIKALIERRDKWVKLVKDYEDVHGGEEE
jgi:hypothetical protein